MKKFVLVAVVALIFSASQAQQAHADTGINFLHAANWQEVLAKAKAENKYIFMDAYTTWCGPCKMMAKNIFPLKNVGEYFNKNFINVKVQLDKTKNDDAYTTSWYGDAEKIEKEYGVRVYPTYLFINPQGQLVHRAVGSSDASTFISKAEKALDESTQYYTLLRKYEGGDHSASLIKNLAMAAGEAYDMENASKFGNLYFAAQPDIFTEENIKLFPKFTFATTDRGFEAMLNHPEKVNAVLGESKAEAITAQMILQKELPLLFKSATEPDWNTFKKKINTSYSNRADVADYAQVTYFQRKGDWDKFSPAAAAYINTYGKKLSPAQINSLAWSVFEHCTDLKCVEQVVAWSKMAAEKTNDPAYYDTYANLLYKSGQKAEAIMAQQKAIDLAKATDNAASYEKTLEKMKAGEKTWE